MKKQRPASLHEALKNLWKIRIRMEKDYNEVCAGWMADRIESLIDHMQYGYALIAYHKQDGTFKLTKATLIPYENTFRREYDILRVTSAIVYWDVELQAWRNFLLENFLEWRPVC
ncbi:MAG: SH3 beta-barrel fold-containing protein [Bacteroides sp.]|nr:SH3 beta-barrel fold-containing protein [Bacteroides sp.]